jgi:hypothetical protein
MNLIFFAASLLLMVLSSTVYADSPSDIVQRYEQIARQAGEKFKGFSADRGKELYFRKEQSAKGEASCSTCHMTDPRNSGRSRANKAIEPLAPAVNGKRFTEFKNVEKWFTRNCDDVLHRPCSTLEKGDFVTYLLSIK